MHPESGSIRRAEGEHSAVSSGNLLGRPGMPLETACENQSTPSRRRTSTSCHTHVSLYSVVHPERSTWQFVSEDGMALRFVHL